MSSNFTVRNTVIPKMPTAVTSLATQSVNFSSVNGIPSGGNILYVINGNLYYKSVGGTITVLAVN